MLIRQPVIALATGALLIAAGSLSASAQSAPGESCTDLYNRTTAAYQGYGPQSPQYAELLNYYNGRCQSGPSAVPAYPSAQPYAYQPAPIDPGAATVGGPIGGAIGGASDSDRGGHRDHRRHL